MNGTTNDLPDGSAAERQLDHEIAEVEAAIAMVRTGAAASVSLTGLGHGAALIEAVRDSASRSHVTVEPIWGWEEDRCDIVVRGIGEDDPGTPVSTGDDQPRG